MLTESRCKAAVPKNREDGSLKSNRLHDGAGLYLQCSPGANDSVNKSWLYRYTIAGKSRQLGLGSYPVVNLADARNAAAVQRAIRASGRDPLLAKRQARAELEAKIRAEKTPRRVVMTFDKAAATYIDTHTAGWKNPKSEAAWRARCGPMRRL
jgi:hypothetical protein